jgi:hypothetical protein
MVKTVTQLAANPLPKLVICANQFTAAQDIARAENEVITSPKLKMITKMDLMLD